MDVPGLGALTWDDRSAWFESEPAVVGALGGRVCRFVLEGYDDDTAPDEFVAAVQALLTADDSALWAASRRVFDYYADTVARLPAEFAPPVVTGPDDVWSHVRLGDVVGVVRADDGRVRLSVECECDWEPEHGLQFVFDDTVTVTKVGPYDGNVD